MVLVQGENERSVLVAYVVYDEQELDLGKLKNFLKLFLPDYMIPAGFVELESIPLTPNGKANRKALLKHEYKVEQSVEFIPPRNETEEILANIWAEMLELDAVGVKDNFFDLGGHSLLATQIIARVKDHFQIELSLSALFETPTIENMAVNILTQEAQTADLDAMSQLLAELEDMDSEDLKDILGTE